MEWEICKGIDETNAKIAKTNGASSRKSLNQTEYTGTSQSDLVKVTVNGKTPSLKRGIKPEAVDPDDVELLQDLVLMATNDALTQAEKPTTKQWVNSQKD